MSELDIIRDVAKKTLTLSRPTGSAGQFFWHRSRRLIRNIDYICQLPEVSGADFQIDNFCLHTAAYFSDVGLARELEAGSKRLVGGIIKNNNDDLLDICTKVVDEKLRNVLGESRIKKVNRIIVESHDQFTRMPEAMILSDARNLDDMGAVGIFNEMKRCVNEGKNISDVLLNWKRKADYRYWQARLKKSFKFESVRKLAEQRLSSAEFFMNQLKVENTAGDLGDLVTKKTGSDIPK